MKILTLKATVLVAAIVVSYIPFILIIALIRLYN